MVSPGSLPAHQELFGAARCNKGGTRFVSRDIYFINACCHSARFALIYRVGFFCLNQWGQIKGVFASCLNRRCYICHCHTSFESLERLPSIKYLSVLFRRSEKDIQFLKTRYVYLSVAFMLVAIISISIVS